MSLIRENMNVQLQKIGLSGIREITALAMETADCQLLSIGDPDFSTSESIKEGAVAALKNNRTHYAPSNGLPQLLQAVSTFEKEKHGLLYAKDEIIITVGATEALFTTLFGILNPGDEVIIPTPAFGLYESMVILNRGVPVFLDTSKDHFQITKESLTSVLSPKTKAIILTSPNNPTGALYTEETLSCVHEAVKRMGFFVICDEVYRDLVFTNSAPFFSSFMDVRDHSIIIQSFSKPYAMTGWRIGYIMAERSVRNELTKVHQNIVVTASTFIQDACLEALKTDSSSMCKTYKERRDFVCARLEGMSLPFEKPLGAFYVFPSIAEFGIPSEIFCRRLIEEAGVCLVPGIFFSTEGFVRISFCYGMEALQIGLDRLEGFITGLRTEAV